MKKNILISILIFIILINFLVISYATLNITEENIKKSIDKYIDDEDDSNTSINLDTTTKQIIFNNTDDTKYIIDYDLSDKPKFSMDLSFNSSMTEEECEIESQKTSLLMLMFIFVADNAEIEFEDSMLYMFSSILDNSNSSQNNSFNYTSTIDFIDAVSYAKALYDNTDNNTVTDTLFTWTHTKVSETSDEYKLKSVLTINTEKDFSIIRGTTDTIANEISNSIISAAQNTANNYRNSISTENLTNTTNVTVTTNTTNKLPQTGKSFNLKDGLQLLSISAFILLIIFIISDIKYKNTRR